MKTMRGFLPPIPHANSTCRSSSGGNPGGIATLHHHKATSMAKLLPSSTTFPALSSDHAKTGQSLVVDKSCGKLTKKKYDSNSKSNPVTSPPSSASGQRKRGGASTKTKQASSKQQSSLTKPSTPPSTSQTGSSNKGVSNSQVSVSSNQKSLTPSVNSASTKHSQTSSAKSSSISPSTTNKTLSNSLPSNTKTLSSSVSSANKIQPISLSSIVHESSPSISTTTSGAPSSSRERSATPPQTSEIRKVHSSEKLDLDNVSDDNKRASKAKSFAAMETSSSDKIVSQTSPDTLQVSQTSETSNEHPPLNRQQNSNSLKLKDEKPKTPMPFELKTGNQFYLPKRKLVQKPVEPFTLFITEKHALARLVWLYLLESQMPFKKISITSKEAQRATHTVPSFCKHCIFTDGDSTLGQPTAIIRHICNFYTNNLLMGADTGEISQAFSWVHWAVSVLHRDLVYLGGSELKRGSHDDVTNELQKSSLDSASLYFDMLDKIFSSRPFLLGPVAWFCDSAVALVLEDANPQSLAQWPSLQAWLLRVKNQPNWATVTNA